MNNIFDLPLNQENYKQIEKHKSEHKEQVLAYLKNGELASIGGLVTDFGTGEWTNIENLDYENGEFYWCTSDIYHFEKYDLKLRDDFVRYVLEQSK